MQDNKRIVRVNVEVVYDDGTFEELKEPDADDIRLLALHPGRFFLQQTDGAHGAGEFLLLVPR